ncbi:MAG: FtsW/RodA/SpoVE family cell cycle protein [Thermoleophilia bacterium]|jgi:cell division protein FtsW (lipid II flippase)|nr:FtsW/RodA/SpoVE family cell cycle protein [Thermoleophilia bacterium]
MSIRARELVFLVPATALALLGLAAVASARADDLVAGPWQTGLGVAMMFVVMHVALRLRAPLADPYLLPVVGLLTGIGLVTLYRIDPELAADQALWVLAGSAVFIAVLVFLPDHRVLERYRYVIGATAIGLLVFTMIFGTEINGSKLWISVGGGQTIQLGELAKVLMVIFLAGYLRDKREVLAIPTQRRLGVSLPALRHFGPVLLFWGAALATVVVLNDFGTALLFFGVFLAMIYMATGRAAYAAVGAGLFAVGSLVVWATVPRIQTRIDAWVDPFGDPQGRGYQMVQSLYALADGGVVGPGLGQASLVTEGGTTRIPALSTDFIFSGVANDLGYVGAVAVLLLFMLVVARGFAIATAARDGFSKLLAGGLTAVMGLQAFLIIGGVIRLVPLTGVTLPFMSYGGSSVVTNFGLVALLLVISHRSRQSLRDAVGEGAR